MPLTRLFTLEVIILAAYGINFNSNFQKNLVNDQDLLCIIPVGLFVCSVDDA